MNSNPYHSPDPSLESGYAGLKLAIGQCTPVPGEVEQNLSLMKGLAQEAVGLGAEVLVLPEMFLTGYAIGATRVRQLAEPVDGPSAGAAAAIARDLGIALVYGYPERGGSGAVYNSAVFVSERGDLLANYRKLHLFGELDREQFAVAHEPPAVFQWRGWNIGLAICYDIEFPEVARYLAEQGVDLICVPTANMVEFDTVAELLVPARAIENQLFVAYANHAGADARFTYGGLSVVAGPSGPLATAGRDAEMVLATLSLPSLAVSREHNTYLSDRRDDVI